MFSRSQARRSSFAPHVYLVLIQNQAGAGGRCQREGGLFPQTTLSIERREVFKELVTGLSQADPPVVLMQ